MLLENLMYFALGLLIAALGALVLLPAVWRRAVRLTKKRIEAATPITMSEFRADKDQLRAEFALQTRRLEMTVETLRKRLADQLRDVNRSKLEMDGLDGERSKHLQIQKEFEDREATQRQRILALEKETADLSQKLRMRERELSDKVTQLEATRQPTRPERVFTLDGTPLSGAYDTDIETLLARLETTRAEAASARQPPLPQAPIPADPAPQVIEETLSPQGVTADELQEAEAHMVEAEQRVSSILAETAPSKEDTHLAQRLSYGSELAMTKATVAAVEREVIADWGTDRIDKAALRTRLGSIATDISRLVNTLDSAGQPSATQPEESLYDRVQKFVGADEAAQADQADAPAALVSDRLKALEQLQDRS